MLAPNFFFQFGIRNFQSTTQKSFSITNHISNFNKHHSNLLAKPLRLHLPYSIVFLIRSQNKPYVQTGIPIPHYVCSQHSFGPLPIADYIASAHHLSYPSNITGVRASFSFSSAAIPLVDPTIPESRTSWNFDARNSNNNARNP